MPSKKRLIVTLPRIEGFKRHSVRFDVEEDDKKSPIKSMYLSTDGYKALNEPTGLKITIESLEE